MQNAINSQEAKDKWNSSKSQIDRAVSDVKSLDTEDLRAVATEFTSKVRDASTNIYNESVGFVKRYPISSALGLAAVGFLFGKLMSRSKQ